MIRARNYLAFSLLFLVAVSACRKSSPTLIDLWGAVNPEIDSLTIQLEQRFYNYADADTSMMMVNRLDSIASEMKDKHLLGRVRFFKARTLYRMGYGGSADDELNAVLHDTDSVTDPYLYNRALQMIGDYSNLTIEDYRRLTALLDYFLEKGDLATSATLYMELGCFLKDVRDPQGAFHAFDCADSLFRKSGYPDIAVRDSINRASAMFATGDTVGGATILHRMLANPLVTSNPKIEGVVLHNLFGYANDTAAIRRLAELEDYPTSTSYTYMAKEALGRGDTREAMKTAHKGLDAALEEEDADAYALALYAIARIHYAQGSVDSAYIYLDEAVELNNEIVDTRDPAAARSLETARLIARERMESELKRSYRLVWVVICFSILFILLVGGAFVLRMRVQKMKIERLRTTLEREKMERRLLAANILIEEKNAVIESVKNSSSVKSHHAQAAGRESFIEVFSELHPSFSTRLREAYPSLTEADVRLASYIAVGLDNKQIAATLGIRHESVKQARWRLRSKLSLQPGDSLERAIAAFASMD